MSKMSDLDLQRSEIVDLNFVTDGTLDRIIARQPDRYENVLRYSFRHHMERALRDAKNALDYSKALVRGGYPAFHELEEIETAVRGMLLAVLIEQRAHANFTRTEPQP